MRFFFRSRQFKIILAVLIGLIVLSVVCIWIGGRISPHSDILGTVTAPFRAVSAKISNGVSDIVNSFKNGNEAMIENTELEAEISELRKDLADYEKVKSENEFYKNYLEIKDKNPDFKFEPSTIISRDTKDPYKSFVINKGSVNSVKEYDPVITDAGLVGYVTQVGLTTSKVTTILSPDIQIGALDNRTNDSGVVSGALDAAKDGKTKLINLSRSCNVAVGDYIVTSGEGIFPEGLLIGVIQSIGNDEYNTSIFAAVKPFAKIHEIREVMVITEFEGQGGINVLGGEQK